MRKQLNQCELNLEAQFLVSKLVNEAKFSNLLMTSRLFQHNTIREYISGWIELTPSISIGHFLSTFIYTLSCF